MSLEAIQKVVVTTLIFGGLGGGYYVLTGSGKGTLSKMHLASGRQLNTDWDAIETSYNDDNNNDLIEGISKKGSKVKAKIKKWCENKGGIYYTDPTDKTYRSYSLWCLQHIDLDTELTKKGYEWKEEHWDKKLKKYNDSNQNFVDENPRATSTPRVELKDSSRLRAWCEATKKKRYKYQGDNDEYRARTYCYWTESELAEATKPAPEPEAVQLPSR